MVGADFPTNATPWVSSYSMYHYQSAKMDIEVGTVLGIHRILLSGRTPYGQNDIALFLSSQQADELAEKLYADKLIRHCPRKNEEE